MTPEIGLAEIALRLVLATVLTGAIGLERELRERGAGLRTHVLVGVGSALFTLVSAYAWDDFVFNRAQGTVLDPTRIAAQIVTGIGFLGAGAIIRQGVSIRGLTTAAGLWVVAAIGMAVGSGFYSAALIVTGVVLAALGPLRSVEGYLIRRFQRMHGVLEIDLRVQQPIAGVLQLFEEAPPRIERVDLDEANERRRLRLRVDLPVDKREELIERVAGGEGVVSVRWM
jgi:putative Mg2+ transporter-C (MgtC) family protein